MKEEKFEAGVLLYRKDEFKGLKDLQIPIKTDSKKNISHPFIITYTDGILCLIQHCTETPYKKDNNPEYAFLLQENWLNIYDKSILTEFENTYLIIAGEENGSAITNNDIQKNYEKFDIFGDVYTESFSVFLNERIRKMKYRGEYTEHFESLDEIIKNKLDKIK